MRTRTWLWSSRKVQLCMEAVRGSGRASAVAAPRSRSGFEARSASSPVLMADLGFLWSHREARSSHVETCKSALLSELGAVLGALPAEHRDCMPGAAAGLSHLPSCFESIRQHESMQEADYALGHWSF